MTREGAIALIDPVTGKTVKTIPVGSAEVGGPHMGPRWAETGVHGARRGPGDGRVRPDVEAGPELRRGSRWVHDRMVARGLAHRGRPR